MQPERLGKKRTESSPTGVYAGREKYRLISTY
jgi:hypothetical protein